MKMGCIHAVTVLILSATAATSLARSAGSGLTFEKYYENSIDTYDTLNLDGYILPRTTPQLMVIREGIPVNIELSSATEIDRQTHASACADACTIREECFGFLVAFNELTDKECQLLSVGNLYKLAGKRYREEFTTAHIEDNYKQVYFTDKSPCPEGQHVMYEYDSDEVRQFLDLGCKKLIEEGNACEHFSHTFENAHGRRICIEGTECVNVADVAYDPKSWSKIGKYCTSTEDITRAEPQKVVREQQMERVRSDMVKGAYEELMAGVYTVPNYKTLRSKFGDTTFASASPFIPEEMKPAPSLSRSDKYSTADEFAWKCGELCDLTTACMGFSIVWQPDTAEMNECYLFSGLINLSEYKHLKHKDYFAFAGQAFVPKRYTQCPEDDQILVFEIYGGSFDMLGCRSEFPGLAGAYHNICYDATNDKYGKCS